MVELSLNRFKDVQKRFFKAYFDFTNTEILIEDIRVNPNHPVIVGILNSMGNELKDADDFDPQRDLNKSGEALSFGTLKILLFTTDDFFKTHETVNFQPILYARIEKYIFLSTLIEDNDNILKGAFKGSYFIDDEFENRVLNNSKHYNNINFYTANLNEGLQWKGIAKHLAIGRSIDIQLKSAVYQAFKHKNTKVCAVVLAGKGMGKTTTLRILAWGLISNGKFKILWIHNLNSFISDLNEIKSNDKDFLLIVDNWAELNSEVRNKFILQITHIENIQVVISDEISGKREYKDHLYGKKYFKIDPFENPEIVSEILMKVPEWQPMQRWIMSLDIGILCAPFVLLFYLLSKARAEYFIDSSVDLNDLIAQTERIVKDDFAKIFEKCEGLAIMLYYYACLCKNHKLYMGSKTFFKLVRQYNNKREISFKQFENDFLGSVLSRYIALKPITVPGWENEHYLEFHDRDLLDILVLPFDDFWDFTDEDVANMIKVLVELKELAFANDLYVSIHRTNKFITNEFALAFSKLNAYKSGSYVVLVYLDTLISDIYQNFKSLSSEECERQLFEIINSFHSQDLGTRELDVFFATLIDYGCELEIVLKLYNGEGNYAARMIDYYNKQGKTLMTLSDFYRHLEYPISEPESKRWLQLVPSEYLAEGQHLTNKWGYGIR